jgi:hypothetical protein
VVFSGLPVSSTNKTDRHDITEILLKVALNTTKQTINQFNTIFVPFQNVSLKHYYSLQISRSDWSGKSWCKYNIQSDGLLIGNKVEDYKYHHSTRLTDIVCKRKFTSTKATKERDGTCQYF